MWGQWSNQRRRRKKKKKSCWRKTRHQSLGEDFTSLFKLSEKRGRGLYKGVETQGHPQCAIPSEEKMGGGGVRGRESCVGCAKNQGKQKTACLPLNPHVPRLHAPPRLLHHGHMRGSGGSACWICCGCSGGGSCSGSSASTMLWQCGGGVPSLLELSATSPLWKK